MRPVPYRLSSTPIELAPRFLVGGNQMYGCDRTHSASLEVFERKFRNGARPPDAMLPVYHLMGPLPY